MRTEMNFPEACVLLKRVCVCVCVCVCVWLAFPDAAQRSLIQLQLRPASRPSLSHQGQTELVYTNASSPPALHRFSSSAEASPEGADHIPVK